MAKFKSTQDLMAARNPLVRKPVEPVDIYTPPVTVEVGKSETTQELINSTVRVEHHTPKESLPQTTAEKKDGSVRSYSTYLFPSQIKGIKLRAIEQDVNDFAIVQEAIDEYLQKHPL